VVPESSAALRLQLKLIFNSETMLDHTDLRVNNPEPTKIPAQ
jgi:hypothetical protein